MLQTDGAIWATLAGFEYTYVGILNSVADLGILMEYSWDSRGEAMKALLAQTTKMIYFSAAASRLMTFKAVKY